MLAVSMHILLLTLSSIGSTICTASVNATGCHSSSLAPPVAGKTMTVLAKLKKCLERSWFQYTALHNSGSEEFSVQNRE